MKSPQKPKAKMSAAARVAAWRTSKTGMDGKVYRPNPRRLLSSGNVWRRP
jgi:hypothetical protein